MRILIASNGYPTKKNPTRQVFIKNIGLGMKQEGHEVSHIYNRYFDLFRSPQETGSALTSVLKVLTLFFSYLPAILIGCRRFDILYSHAPLLPGLLMVLASKLHGITHVTYVHGSVNEYIETHGVQYRLAKYAMNKSDHVFTNSEYMRKKLISDYSIESVVITPGYRSDIFYNTGTERTTDLLFAGNCIHGKGIHLFVKAIADHPSFYQLYAPSVRICCSGILKSQIINFCYKNNIDNIIQFEDKLQENELSKAFNQAKIVVLPSLNEALGLVGIESIACGAFLVASNVGGIPEYVEDGKNGILFEPGSSEALHRAIKKTMTHHSWKKQSVGTSTANQELKPFTLSTGIDQTLSFFNRIN